MTKLLITLAIIAASATPSLAFMESKTRAEANHCTGNSESFETAAPVVNYQVVPVENKTEQPVKKLVGPTNTAA